MDPADKALQQLQDAARDKWLAAETADDRAILKHTGAVREYEAARATFEN